jgi:hypothetical protein
MGLIPTRIHGVLDYLVGAWLIAMPWVFGFGRGAQTLVAVLMGGVILVYSMLTDYELAAVRLIPMTAHVGLDVLGGLFLAGSPWIFGFAETMIAPHLALGLLAVGVAVFTETTSSYEATPVTTARVS